MAAEPRIQSSIPEENTMRSELVFGALTHVSNRFLLTRLAAKATRKFHRPSTRIQETMDDIFTRFGHVNPLPVIREGNNVRLHRGATNTELGATNTELTARYTHHGRSVA
jgi:hypothetical protein